MNKIRVKQNNQQRIIILPLLILFILALLLTGCSESEVTSDAASSDEQVNAEDESTAVSDEPVIAETDSAAATDVQVIAETDSAATTDVQVIAEGESLIIPISELTDTVQFYAVEVDGTSMEVMAVLDSDETIRTAFNTCQICYSSGKGYYEQSGDTLICQNCGNQFTIDQIEVESGGCNPWPIFAEDKTVTEDSLSITYDFLKESSEIFENWKIR